MADETRPAASPAEGSSSGERPDRGERRPPRPGGPGGPGGREGGRKYFRRKKVCKFCVEKIEAINYKDVRLLAQFVAESGKIVVHSHQAGAQHRPVAIRRPSFIRTNHGSTQICRDCFLIH